MDWKALVSTVAPWIGTAIGGPLGGMAVTAVGNALGLDVKTEDTIRTALLGATPEQMLALKEADQKFQAQMEELGFKNVEALAAIDAGDRKDARAMQVAKASPVPALLSILITVGFFGILGGMLYGKLSSDDNQALLLMLGALGAAWGQVVAFWFGSTHNSFEKTKLLAQSAPPSKGA